MATASIAFLIQLIPSSVQHHPDHSPYRALGTHETSDALECCVHVYGKSISWLNAIPTAVTLAIITMNAVSFNLPSFFSSLFCILIVHLYCTTHQIMAFALASRRRTVVTQTESAWKPITSSTQVNCFKRRTPKSK